MSVAQRVKISSMVLFLRRDCAGGAGPVVELCAPIVLLPPRGALLVPGAGVVVVVVPVVCGAEVVVDDGNEKGLAAGAEVAAGCEGAVVGGGPNENGFEAGAEVAAEDAGALSDEVDGAAPPPRFIPPKSGV